jgi:hypothetical protein
VARVLVGAGVLALAASAGCGAFTSVGGRAVEFRSVENTALLQPTLPLVVFEARDLNTADFYLTDLADEDLVPGADWTGVSGQIVHVRLFLRPRAGQTPIDRGACTAIVRTLVLSRGEVGLYGGGGFMLVSGDPGDARMSGSISGASVRLQAATEAFIDALGAAEFSGSWTAQRDDATAREIGATFESAVLRLPRREITPTTPAMEDAGGAPAGE